MKLLKAIIWIIVLLVAWSLWSRRVSTWPEELRISLAALVCLVAVGILGRKGIRLWGGASSNSGSSKRLRTAGLWFTVSVFSAIGFALFLRSPAEQLVVVWQEAFPNQVVKSVQSGNGEQEVSGNWLWTDGTRRALPRKTNLKPGKKPELFLRFDDSALSSEASKRPLYVSAVHFDHYRNSAWEIDTVESETLEAKRDGQILLGSRRPAGGIWHTIVLSSSAEQKSPLVGLQGINRVKGLPQIERWSDGMHILPPTGELGKGYRYRVLSHPLRLEDAEAVADSPPQGIEKRRWLALPDFPLVTEINRLSDRIVRGSNDLARARSIETYLRENYEYSLSTQNQENLDPLQNFLFEEKSGHCEYFATAGALMARASGIPARLVYGWAGGTWYEYANWFVFRADEAHAWVEVWLEDRGWVVMDPTPEAALRARGSRKPGEKLPSLPRADEELLEMDDDSGVLVAERFPWGIASLLLALAFGIYVATRRRSGVIEVSQSGTEPWREAIPSHYFELWRKHCGKQNPGRDLHSSTLRQQLKWCQPEPEFSDDLRSYHYAVRYQGEPANRSRERELAKRIRAWAVGFGNKT